MRLFSYVHVRLVGLHALLTYFSVSYWIPVSVALNFLKFLLHVPDLKKGELLLGNAC